MARQLQLIFPTVISKSKLDREFTKDEYDFVLNNTNDCNHNYGNATSNNNYILESKELSSLKEFCLKELQDFLEVAYQPKHDIEIYITQSWLNYTNNNEFHHRHEHPNSFISGVFYIEADEKADKIVFSKSNYQQIAIESKNPEFCYLSYYLPVNKYDLLFFPSHLTHEVPKTTNPNTRISLSFNSFIKGNLGDNKSLTELILK